MEIDHLSKNLLENKKQIDISGLRLNDIILNTRVLNDWLIYRRHRIAVFH